MRPSTRSSLSLPEVFPGLILNLQEMQSLAWFTSKYRRAPAYAKASAGKHGA
jgi:hypothetical protein